MPNFASVSTREREEIREDLRALVRVRHLRMKLDAEARSPHCSATGTLS